MAGKTTTTTFLRLLGEFLRHLVPLALPLVVINGLTLAVVWPFILKIPTYYLVLGLLVLSTIACVSLYVFILWKAFRREPFHQEPPSTTDQAPSSSTKTHKTSKKKN